MGVAHVGDNGNIRPHQSAQILDFTKVVHAGLDNCRLMLRPQAKERQGRTDIVVEIDGVQYVIAYKVYEEALAPGQTTEPSLKQVFMSPDADNEITELFMNTYTILALSQGTQTAGFDSAEVALNTAFGEVTGENVLTWLAETPIKTTGFNNVVPNA